MTKNENAVLNYLKQGSRTRTLLRSTGALKERIQRVRAAAGDPAPGSCAGGWGNSPVEGLDGSCGGLGVGWGNSPVKPEDGGCGGVGGGWGDSPGE